MSRATGNVSVADLDEFCMMPVVAELIDVLGAESRDGRVQPRGDDCGEGSFFELLDVLGGDLAPAEFGVLGEQGFQISLDGGHQHATYVDSDGMPRGLRDGFPVEGSRFPAFELLGAGVGNGFGILLVVHRVPLASLRDFRPDTAFDLESAAVFEALVLPPALHM
ncbi:hypothetical protein CYMTET_38841 [Cymbomonas tetramitiformis]|uniref:Uncharacterized protein n=1 Tax=Cymbomonas tetramitiformis TaxID=36881 RepID=A0AAE0CDA7_9CHLO|nr:hypothetical protein CYMTET_38841 [Cymbomonas tetramitiformis]